MLAMMISCLVVCVLLLMVPVVVLVASPGFGFCASALNGHGYAERQLAKVALATPRGRGNLLGIAMFQPASTQFAPKRKRRFNSADTTTYSWSKSKEIQHHCLRIKLRCPIDLDLL